MILAQRASILQGVVSGCIVSLQSLEQISLEEGVAAAVSKVLETRDSGRSVYLIGNGGSAAVASHCAVDFINVVKVPSFVLHEPAVFSCMSNDYGYENAFAKILNTLAKPSDLLIAISSSGNSKNIINACQHFFESGGTVITLTGFAENNSIRKLGHLNFWLSSEDYGIVEIGHQFILHNLADRVRLGHT